MNSGINYLMFYPIINKIYGNTFKQQRLHQKTHNQKGFSPNHFYQQGFYRNPFNQTPYLNCGYDGLVLYQKQVREVLIQQYDNIFNFLFIGALLLNQKATREKWYKTIINMKRKLLIYINNKIIQHQDPQKKPPPKTITPKPNEPFLDPTYHLT